MGVINGVNGDINSKSWDTTEAIQLTSAVNEGFNRITGFELHLSHTTEYAHALLATTPTFDPDTYSYNLDDNLLVTIINMSDAKKYHAQCMSNPCALVQKLN